MQSSGVHVISTYLLNQPVFWMRVAVSHADNVLPEARADNEFTDDRVACCLN